MRSSCSPAQCLRYTADSLNLFLRVCLPPNNDGGGVEHILCHDFQVNSVAKAHNREQKQSKHSMLSGDCADGEDCAVWRLKIVIQF